MGERRARRFFEPSAGHGLPHSPFQALVAPRPIGWMSTRAADGTRNLAPFSFANAFSARPPIVGFSSTGPTDTLANAVATGEFCWNLVTSELAAAMSATSASVRPEVDEFALAGLTAAASRVVGAPHVAEARVVLECRVSQVLPLSSAAGEATGATLVLGEVVGVHIDDELIVDGVYRTGLAEPVLRGGGTGTYFTIDERDAFEMPRPGA